MDKTISMFALGGGMRPNPDMNELYNAGNVYMNKQ
jgi:hypothetical protein